MKKPRRKKAAAVTSAALPAMPIARMLAMVSKTADRLDGDAALLMRSLAKALKVYRSRLFAAVKLANDERDAVLAKLEKVRAEGAAPTYDKWKDRAEWVLSAKVAEIHQILKLAAEDGYVDLQ